MGGRLRIILPLLVLIALAVVFVIGLQHDPRKLPSVLVDKPAPAFSLPALSEGQTVVTPDALKGKVWLMNVFASWCGACVAEHPLLLAIAAKNAVPLVGLAYKDEPADTREWLAQRGNPYTQIAIDRNGLVGIDYGVYGVPETFVIDGAGVIRYKQVGPVDEAFFIEHVAPLLAQEAH
jgi:cytochrome c biogenesis protein CcmG/thiol:disulfide interchange protein DsbE